MNPWLRRSVYLVIILAWLLVMAFPTFAFLLAMRGQLQFGDDNGRHIRIFLLQDQDAEGVGVEQQRLLREPAGCRQTSVRYFMWSGEGENITFCQCFDPVTNAPLPTEGQVCEQ